MKILHCIFSFNTGGAETLLVDIINQQVFTHSVCLCIINDAYDPSLISNINEKCKIILINRKPKSRNLWSIARMNKMIYSFHPDVIHCHDSNIISYLFIHPFFYTVATIHGTKLSLIGAKKYNEIVCVSKAVGNDLHQRGIKDYRIIQNGINIEAISQKENSFSPDKCTFKIIQIGRLEHGIKGQHLLIQALSILKERGVSDITVDFIGSGSSLDYLKKLTMQLNLDRSIRFLGLKDRNYIYSNLKNYNLLVQPSINEGFGLTIAEGMITGIPVLVSNIEGPMEVVKEGVYGYTFESNNAESLSEQIVYILNHPSESQEMGLKGKKYAMAHYGISNVVDEYDKIYTMKQRKEGQ